MSIHSSAELACTQACTQGSDGLRWVHIRYSGVGMGKLTDNTVKGWIAKGERFEGRSDGGGLILRYRAADASPTWRFRYRFAGKQRVMNLGTYPRMTLAQARKEANRLAAQVTLGIDVAGEKQARIREAVEKIEAETVAQLADRYFDEKIAGRWKHPNIVRGRIEKDIKPAIGHMRVEDVSPKDIKAVLKRVKARGAPTVENDVLRWLRRIFDHAIREDMIDRNPAAAFDLSDAGGEEKARSRALSRAELVAFFGAMRTAKGFSVQNELTIKLLLLLAVRKMELAAARWDEFDMDGGVWYLPGERTKTGEPTDIPLPPLAVEWLRELNRLAGGSAWVLPARKMQSRMLPHVAESTINVALAKVKHGLPAFTLHDLRRTARSQLAALGVEPHIAERCLNHKIKGVEGTYNRHSYFEERRQALSAWADLLAQLEAGDADKVMPIRGAA